MSRATQTTFTCPCGTQFTSPVYESVNIGQDPQLQYTVLSGLLNVSTCPDCGRRAAVARPFIYSDPIHHLLAYVHPQSDAPNEARQVILEKLQDIYTAIVEQDENAGNDTNGSFDSAIEAAQTPPLQVVFGVDQLSELINAFLPQDERLGRLALSTRSHDQAERAQMVTIARKLASEMYCQIEVEDLSDEFTVWVYGSRRQIGALMRELAPRG
ncbi:MAG TPA: CpXC domain-containing protein [Ktedonobacteraceae bacterium]|nr:CpXC domain-containing protein [Ktedonobacteraceae bacterium]